MTLLRRTLLELRAFPRTRYVWTAALAIAAFNALLATVLAPKGIMAFSLVAMALVPTAMAPLAASSFAALRADRLSDRLHTAGVPARGFLVPRALALLLVGALYLLLLLPVYLVLGAKMGGGWPEEATRWYYVGGGLVAYGVVAGLLFATLLPGAKGAPTALAGGLAVFSLLVATLWGLVVDAAGPGLAMRVLHLLPHVALFEGAGFAYGSPLRPADPARSQLAFALYLALMLAVAIVARSRYQNATGWRVGSRRGLLLGLALVALVPVAAASGAYEPRDRGVGSTPSLASVVVARGAPFGSFDEPEVFPLAQSSDADVLVEKPRGWDPGARIVVKGSGDAGVHLTGTPRVEGDLIRIPVTVSPTGGFDTRVHVLTVRIKLAGGEELAQASFYSQGEAPRAQLFLAAAPAIGLAALGAILRRRSVAA